MAIKIADTITVPEPIRGHRWIDLFRMCLPGVARSED
jgi:hypothetical protein